MDLIGQVLLNTIHYLHYCEENMKNHTSLPPPVFKTKYYFLRNKSNYFFNIHAIRVFTKPNTITKNTNSFNSFSKANNV